MLDRVLRKDQVEDAGLNWAAVQGVRQRLRSHKPGQAQATVHALAVYLMWWEKHGHRMVR